MSCMVARNGIAAIAGVLQLCCIMAVADEPGDRTRPVTITYPPAAYYHNGGRIIDVTTPPFSAKGDSVTDNTAALVAVMNFLRDKIAQFDVFSANASYAIYFPAGTYLVSNTITYDGPRVQDQRGFYDLSMVRIIGEDRRTTVVRLKDNSSGFGTGSNKPVISLIKCTTNDTGSNTAFSMQVRNITVNTGRGNPGAVGVVFVGANYSHIADLTIVSGDGQGGAGLRFPTWSVQGCFTDITVDGFDYGVRADSYKESNPTLEYVTCRNQQRAAVHVERSSPCIRKLLSVNTVPGLEITSSAAQVVLIDSKLSGGSAASQAIILADTTSQLLVRNCTTDGYGGAVRRAASTVVATGTVTEYISDRTYTLFTGSPTHTMGLPIEDAPPVGWENDTAKWANVDQYPGASVTEKVQNALNSGRPVVYFPSPSYSVRKVSIPSTVMRLDFMYAAMGGVFSVDGQSPQPILIENAMSYPSVELAVPRTVAMRLNSGAFTNVQAAPVRVYLEACVNLGISYNFCRSGQLTWARSINNEYKNTPNFKVSGGSLWVLGFKTEGPAPSFHVRNGGWCEVLGGYRNETMTDSGYPIVINDTANVALTCYTTMSQVYQQAVWETRGGETRRLLRTDLPVRKGYRDDFYVPLYTGYTGSPNHTVVPIADNARIAAHAGSRVHRTTAVTCAGRRTSVTRGTSSPVLRVLSDGRTSLGVGSGAVGRHRGL